MVRTLVPADLNGTLEVNLHRIGEFEGLEMSIRQDGSTGAKVLDLAELGHEFGSGNAALLIHQLDGSAFAVMSHAVTDEHVEFLVVVLDGQDHGHGLTDFDES